MIRGPFYKGILYHHESELSLPTRAWTRLTNRRTREKRLVTEWCCVCRAPVPGKAGFAVRGQSWDYLGIRTVVGLGGGGAPP